MHVLGRNRDQLRVRPVPVLADDVRAVVEPGIDQHAVADLESGDAAPSAGHDAGAVRAEDPRLRNGGESLADPDVQMVQRGGAKTDQHLARSRFRVGNLLDDEYLGTAVLVNPDGLHCAWRLQFPTGECREYSRRPS